MSRTFYKKRQDQLVENKNRDLLNKMTIGKGKRLYTYKFTLGTSVICECPFCHNRKELSREQSGQYMRQLFYAGCSIEFASKMFCEFCSKEVYGVHGG